MPSPFPGMDPYLEAPSIWEDFHANLGGEIQAQLTPFLRPKYVAALTPHITYDEIIIETPPRTVKPDVSVLHVANQPYTGEAIAIAPSPLIGQVTQDVPVKLVSVEIRAVEDGTLVTAIEILSPVNKRSGHEAFRRYDRKRRSLMRSEANLLEIDLLCQGKRFPMLTPLPNNPYFIFLHRGSGSTDVFIWPLSLAEPIPPVPVPLLEPDPDLPLDLGKAIQNIYDRAAYDLRIDYSQPPPKPDLSDDETAWIHAHLKAFGCR
jgi:hypothetical protein